MLAGLTEQGLKPVGDADKLTLIRRVTFDLTGLPPTPEEIDAFLADQSADGVRAGRRPPAGLAAFGERWGRHWLDVARYGESTGLVAEPALSACLALSRLRHRRVQRRQAVRPVRPRADRRRPAAGDDRGRSATEQLIATGFLALGVKDVNQRFKVRFVMDNVDEQIDAVSRSVLALTVSCARCHDHKFDPIPTTDYYALAGIFRSTDLCAGLRNKMGGGGLDYYDTAMLLPLGPATPPDPEPAEKIDGAKKAACRRAEPEFETARGTPRRTAKAPTDRPGERPPGRR